MALTHLLRGFWDEPWEGMTEPSRLYDQHFGNLVSDDFFGQPYRFYRPALHLVPRLQGRPPQQTGKSEVCPPIFQSHRCIFGTSIVSL